MRNLCNDKDRIDTVSPWESEAGPKSSYFRWLIGLLLIQSPRLPNHKGKNSGSGINMLQTLANALTGKNGNTLIDHLTAKVRAFSQTNDIYRVDFLC